MVSSCVLLLHLESGSQLDLFQTCIGCTPSVSGEYKIAVPDNRSSPLIMRPSVLTTLMGLLWLVMRITLLMSDQ